MEYKDTKGIKVKREKTWILQQESETIKKSIKLRFQRRNKR
jgi:hypothetical protein